MASCAITVFCWEFQCRQITKKIIPRAGCAAVTEGFTNLQNRHICNNGHNTLTRKEKNGAARMLVCLFSLNLRLPRYAARVAGAFFINDPSHQSCIAQSRLYSAVQAAAQSTRLSLSIPQVVGATARSLVRGAMLYFPPAMNICSSNTFLCGRPAARENRLSAFANEPERDAALPRT